MGQVFFVPSVVPFSGATVPKQGTRMLEALVSSRIRRHLFEYLLAHPADRFYLRGLAKDLGLSISPLRRELKRLEHSGMLRASHEGNMLFYLVDTASPAYRQLSGAGAGQFPAPAFVPAMPALAGAGPIGAIPVGVIRHETRLATARRVWPVALATVLGLAGMVTAVDLSLRAMTHQTLFSRPSSAGVPAVAGAPSTGSGVMRGQRWQVVPGTFGGGFAADAAHSLETF